MQNMLFWGLKVHEMLYIECGGVTIMFPDELIGPKKAYRVLP